MAGLYHLTKASGKTFDKHQFATRHFKLQAGHFWKQEKLNTVQPFDSVHHRIYKRIL